MLFESIIIIGGYTILLSYLTREQFHHEKRISNIKHRIHINGIRGKSSVTRIVGQILRDAGINTFTKTTGSAARLIDHYGKEEPIRRRVANIIEQISIVKKVSKHNPEAIVIECMAVQPLLQRVCEEKMINATIGVLTNVREDHQDKMGWTLEEITHSLCEFMPSNGILICGERDPKLVKIIKKRAKENNTRVILSNGKLPGSNKDILKKLNYIEHEENISLALKVAEVLGIDKETAMASVLNVQPDPGALKIYKKNIKDSEISFVNAHAINDKESLVKVYELLVDMGYLDKTNIGILYNRYDRPERVEMFADIATKKMTLDAIIPLGHFKDAAKARLIQNGFPEHKIFTPRNENIQDLLSLIYRIVKMEADKKKSGKKEANVIGMVNIHGQIVEDYIKYFTN
jgi:poly-gamma-glutamate synthase PgsB/CapB